MNIWKLKVDQDAPLYFTNLPLVLEWLALFDTDAEAELITVESVYVNEE